MLCCQFHRSPLPTHQALLRCTVSVWRAGDRDLNPYSVSIKITRQGDDVGHKASPDNAQSHITNKAPSSSPLVSPAPSTEPMRSGEAGGRAPPSFIIESSVDVLSLYLSLLTAEERKSSFLSSPLPHPVYGAPSCSYRSVPSSHSQSSPTKSDSGTSSLRSPPLFHSPQFLSHPEELQGGRGGGGEGADSDGVATAAARYNRDTGADTLGPVTDDSADDPMHSTRHSRDLL